MPIFVRPAMQDDLALVEEIENAADSLLVELLEPGEWEPAATGLERAAWPGYILVSSETVGGPAVGFVHVIEGEDFAHLEQISVLRVTVVVATAGRSSKPRNTRRGFAVNTE